MSSIKVVDIYGITKACRAMTQLGGYVRMFERPAFTTDGLELLLNGAPSETIKVYDLPIHRIRTPKGDRFVAIEPDLKALLELPFEARARAAEEWSRETRQLADRRVAMESGFRYRLQAMPWWRRALFVLRRSNLETQP